MFMKQNTYCCFFNFKILMFISVDKAFFEQINNVNHAGSCCFMKISKRKTKHLIKSHKENLHICVRTNYNHRQCLSNK